MTTDEIAAKLRKLADYYSGKGEHPEWGAGRSPDIVTALTEAASVISDVTIERNQLRAKVDALMLEYCPDEMTPEQTAEWARHQIPVHPGRACPHCGTLYLTGTGLARHIEKNHPEEAPK